ncbi:cytosolic leucyl tRNA synthetase [Kickxella alabastrina]|uniref:Cytosolic leucyl tRNA synthetase n=1 Tax=Kickxella alabastrina TaxID=61397 RepID=A0ACC1I586_9FUNG|nr:cytosolic leucyl tRNA synthetase [Kickxella alabastrina]
MYTLMEWVTDAYKALELSEQTPNEPIRVNDIFLCPATAPFTTIDRVFNAEIDKFTLATGAAYEATMYRDALKNGLYDFQISRDGYREFASATGMHPTLVRKWITRQVIQLCPITPHWSEHVWKTIMGNTDSIMNARWPTDLPATADHALIAAGDYIRSMISSVRVAEVTIEKRIKKKGGKSAPVDEFNPKAPKSLDVFVASEFPAWQESVISVLKEHFDVTTAKFDDKQIVITMNQRGIAKQNKKAMSFAQDIKKRVSLIGPSAFDRALNFKEIDVLGELKPYLKSNLKYDEVTIIDLAQDSDLSEAQAKAADNAVPGEPSFLIANVQ